MTRIFRADRPGGDRRTPKQARFYRGLTLEQLTRLWRAEIDARELDRLLHGPLLHTNPNYRQVSARGYVDSAASSESLTAIAAINTGFTQNVDEVFHYRYEVQETAGGSGNIRLDLEYDLNLSGTYNPVTTTSTHIRNASGNGTILCTSADGDATTDLMTGLIGAFFAGQYDTDGTTNNNGFSGNDHTEQHCALILVGANLSDGDIIRVRPIGLNAYIAGSQIQITANVPQPANTVAASYRIQGTGSETAAFVANLNTPYTPVAQAGTNPYSIGVRYLIQNTGDLPETSDAYDAYYQVNGAGFNPAGNGPADVQYDNGSGLTDGGATTQRLGAGTFVAGAQRETVTDVTNVTVPGLSETEMLYAVEWDANLLTEGNFQVRPEFSGGVDLDGYTNTAQINVNAHREQSYFGWYADDNADPDLTTQRLAPNTNDTITTGDLDTPIHLRIGYRQWMASKNSWEKGLEYRRNGGAWSAVTAASSFVRYADGTPVQGAVCDTQRVSGAAPETYNGGRYIEATGFSFGTSGDRVIEDVFCIQFRSADVANADIFDFRIVDETLGGPIEGLSELPSATISLAAPTATGAQTLQLLTQAAVAAESYPAAGAQTLQTLTQSAIAAEIYAAQAAQTLQQLAQAATAAESYAAAAAQTLQQLTQGAVAAETYAAAGAQTLQQLVQAAVATHGDTATAAGAQTLQLLTQAANALMQPDAAGAQTLQQLAQAASAAEAYLAAAAQTLQQLAQAASVEQSQPVNAAAAQTLQLLAQAAIGVQEYLAAAAQTLQPISQASIAQAFVPAAGAQTLPAPTQSAVAEAIMAAAAAQTLALATQAASGLMQPDAAGAQTLQLLTQAGVGLIPTAGLPGPGIATGSISGPSVAASETNAGVAGTIAP